MTAIQNMDATRARQVLEVVVRSIGTGEIPLELTPDLRMELASVFGAPSSSTEVVSDDDLTKQALMVLAEDPDRSAAIQTMSVQPELAAQKFEIGSSIALTTAVIIVLQTHVRFERNEDGKWSVKVEKKPSSDSIVKTLVQKLMVHIK